jgi:hypothetical protein
MPGKVTERRLTHLRRLRYPTSCSEEWKHRVTTGVIPGCDPVHICRGEHQLQYGCFPERTRPVADLSSGPTRHRRDP